MDETFSQTTQGYVRNELVLPKLHRSDLLVTYTCQAVNTNLTVPVSSSITIDINCKYRHKFFNHERIFSFLMMFIKINAASFYLIKIALKLI